MLFRSQMTTKKSNDRAEFQKQVTFGPCSHCGLRNHRTQDCRRKPQTVKENKTNDFTCFICHREGHKKRDCPTLKHSGMHKPAAMQMITHNHPQICQSQSTRKNCGSTSGELEFACGCKMPVIAGAVSPDGQRKLIT